MVYFFGVNVPLVEVLFVIGLITLVSVILVIWTLLSLRKLGKKLDKIIREERIVKNDLNIALKEEKGQIRLLADLMGNVKVMQRISKQKSVKLKKAEKVIQKVGKKKDKTKEIKRAIKEIKAVDKLSKREDNVLRDIGKNIDKYVGKGINVPKNLLSMLKKVLPEKVRKR